MREAARRSPGPVVVPGLVDAAHGVATYCSNIGWRDLADRRSPGERWGVPVRLAQRRGRRRHRRDRQGAGRGETHVAFVPCRHRHRGGHPRRRPADHRSRRRDGRDRSPPVRPSPGLPVRQQTAVSTWSRPRRRSCATYAARSGGAVSGAGGRGGPFGFRRPVARGCGGRRSRRLADAIPCWRWSPSPHSSSSAAGSAWPATTLVSPLTAAVGARTASSLPPRITVAGWRARWRRRSRPARLRRLVEDGRDLSTSVAPGTFP